MSTVFGYFLTWTTYGSWLPGDDRGWVRRSGTKVESSSDSLVRFSHEKMTADAVVFTPDQRAIVEQAIRDHCQYRGWELHAINVRTNHVHVVVTAECDPLRVMEEFKAWGSRRLNERFGKADTRKRWWTRDGSRRWLKTQASFWQAIEYVVDYQ